jgi:hypothetical protein
MSTVLWSATVFVHNGNSHLISQHHGPELRVILFVEYLALWLCSVHLLSTLRNPFQRIIRYFIGIDGMKLLDRLLEMFGWRRKIFLGAVGHPNDFMAYIHAVRASAYYKITGKYLSTPKLSSKTKSEDISDQFSPLRRLSRKWIE